MEDFVDTSRAPRFVPNGPAPTAEQVAIQLAKERVCLVQANAGAGKTSVLVARIGEAVARGTSPGNILALTFTDTAASVLNRRLAQAGIHVRAAEQVHVFTFDKFSRHVLSRLPGDDSRATQFELDRDLAPWIEEAMDNVPDETVEAFPEGTFEPNHVNVALAIDAMRRLKASGALFDDIYDENLDGMLETLGVTRAQFIITIEYERIRRGRDDEPRFRDPYDATYDLAKAIGMDAIADAYLGPYSLVVCDEQHDFNEAAYRVLCRVLLANQCRFLGVGDKDQVIHATLGASDTYMGDRFRNDFTSTELYPLSQTFRHGPHIAYPVAAFKQKTIESYVRTHTPIQLVEGDGSPLGVANAVADEVAEWAAQAGSADACAILLRDWHQSALIEEVLWRRNIRYRAPAARNFHHREEIRFVRGVFAYALGAFGRLESSDRVAIAATLALFGNVQIEPGRVREMQALLAQNPELFEEFLKTWLVGDVPERPVTKVGALVLEIRGLVKGLSAVDGFKLIRTRIDFGAIARRVYAKPYDAEMVSRSLDAFESAMAGKPDTLAGFFDTWLTTVTSATTGRRVERVIIDTVSNVKGREFDRVILPYMDRNEFPNPHLAHDQEANLFYVAATRARNKLVLVTSSTDAVLQSRFIGDLALETSTLRADIALDRNRQLASADSIIRIYLKHYDPRDHAEIRGLGASYDPARRQWYITSDMSTERFLPWL
ncbi:UvrD-helicase domain-containing protein [Pandoraea sp. PE-S2R-1]|uniref:UvrD-helicase domain-containing protein n=1 Tax=Pandoraea sp. PE-S2R-1 TaxID=1986994 RepID=UPI000B3FCF47|nr:UvrD-helicase domain-containing protein [Pandoraea sp. PE-S2R-1]